MVRRFFNFLNSEILGIHQAAFLLGFFALSSQFLALIRDRLLAHNFGAGIELDIYYAAFRVPDFIFVTVGSIVSISIIVPFLVEHFKKGFEEAGDFINQVFTYFFSIIIFINGLIFLLAPFILSIVFPGFSGDNFESLVLLTRIMLISPILLGVSNLLGSISQTYKRFFLYALSPVMYNFGIIFGIIFLIPYFGILGVVLGVIIGALLHLSVHLPFVIKKGLLPKISLKPNFSLFRLITSTSIPRTLTLSITHLLILVFISIASLMSDGSITIFSFSFNIQSVILSIVGVSYSVAVFPTLAKLFSEGKRKMFWDHVTVSAQHIIFWSVPAAVLFIVLRAQIVRVILGTGLFGWEATQLTAAALALFSFSVVFQGLILLFVKSYYAMGKTFLPLKVNVFSGISGVVSAFILLFIFKNMENFRFFIEALLRVEELNGTEVLMLPLGFSLGMIVNGVLLWVLIEKQYRGFSAPIISTFSQVFAAAVIGGSSAYVVLGVYSIFIELDTLINVLIQGVLAGLVAVLMNVLVLILLKNKEIKTVLETVKRRFWKIQIMTGFSSDNF